MKQNILILLFLLPNMLLAQTYKYIGMENGLSNRRVFSINKDTQGYMWFLTDEGMDRYNGQSIRHYQLNKDANVLETSLQQGWVYTQSNDDIWVIGRQGRVSRYDRKHDDFRMIHTEPDSLETVSFGYVDRDCRIWLCHRSAITLFRAEEGDIVRFPNPLHGNITAIEQIDEQHFFLATETGVRYVRLDQDALHLLPITTLDYFHARVTDLYYHPQSRRLFIGSFERGLFIYDMGRGEILKPDADLSDVSITGITSLDDNRLLVGTEGMGVYTIGVEMGQLSPFIVADYNSYNEMNGNNISCLFVDEEKRIWLANYPSGITVIDSRYKNYLWIKHSMGNRQSLVNDQVHAVIEDSDGDLWFGTSNGISLYNTSTGQWHSFLSSFDEALNDKNHIFITLCEVSPGVVWAGGYTSGIYKINKYTLSVEYFSPYLLTSLNIRPDKYIRDMVKDSEGNIWSGGYYNLKCSNSRTNSTRLYSGINTITSIVEHDKEHMWVGTTTGLYLLDKRSGDYRSIETGTGPGYINSLYQAPDGRLYIGTNGAGLFLHDPVRQTFEHYYTDNSALVSNRILTILPETGGRIIMSTENGITCFDTNEKIFHNWTRGEGLLPACFNAAAGCLCRDGRFLFGSTDGAIELPGDVKFPTCTFSHLLLGDFHISYQPVYPDDEDSPLEECIDLTKDLRLDYEQNTFSLEVSTINYDSPGNILYSWKLEGFDGQWTQPGTSGLIRFTNLPSGKYNLRIRAISREEHDIVYEERTMRIVVSRPLWLSWWALLGYGLFIVWVVSFILRTVNLRKQQKISDEKTRFFINTAHDIRTPLTLIKAPLEELLAEESFSASGIVRTKTALRNVDSLLRLVGNLINFERADVYSSGLCATEHELCTYLQEVCSSFSGYANSKHIELTCQCDFHHKSVWFDREKMDSILKNLLSNALKYTPEHGKVSLSVSSTEDSWKVTISDTGIGIPASEQKKLFKLHFRASNAVNSKITGSGIGLMLVYRLVRQHRGKIRIESVEHRGTTVRMVFPVKQERSVAVGRHPSVEPFKAAELEVLQPNGIVKSGSTVGQPSLPRILVAEDNDELRSYLVDLLSSTYHVCACSNGREALMAVKEFWPELVLSDVMMPEMRGDELCVALKQDIETSHLPVLLLTALGEENDVIEGLSAGADEYIIKPFSVRLLRASIANLLANRALLRKRYSNLEMELTPEPTPPNGMSSLDWNFLLKVKSNILEHLDMSGFTVDTLCDLHHMSRTSFYNKIKLLTGQTPTELIRNIRLQRAAQLLKEREYTIAEVADMTGFSDSKYFREVFKKYYKVSPSQYAKGEIDAKEGGAEN